MNPPAAVRFHRLASGEYLEARRWYDRRREGLGGDFGAEVDRAVRRIADRPDRWPIIRGNYRRVRLRRFHDLDGNGVDACRSRPRVAARRRAGEVPCEARRVVID